MLKKIWNHKVRFAGGLFIVLMFVLIRFFEKSIFYDPFILYFKNDFNNLPLPDFNGFQLTVGLFFKYTLNTLLSLGLLYLIFKEKEMIRFIGLLYLLFFVLLISAFFGLIYI